MGGWALPTQSIPPLQKTYRQGVQALSDQDAQSALKLFRACLKAKPDFAEAMLGMAEAYQQLQKPGTAARWVAKALATAPNNPHVQNSLGRLKMMRGDVKAAEQAFRRALALDPGMASAWASLGLLYTRGSGRLDQAVDAYAHALKIDPLNADYLYKAGVLYARQGDDVKAADALLRASRLDPDMPGPRLGLADIAVKHQQWANALKWTDSVLTRQPAQLQALWLKTNIATRAGRPGLAAATLHTILQLQPENASAWLLLGANRQGVADWDGALKAYQKAFSIKPNLTPALNNFAWVAASQGKSLDQALEAARKAVQLQPKVAAFHDTLAWVYYARGDYGSADKILAKLAETGEENSALIHFHYGLVLDKQKHPKAARQWLEKALGEGLSASQAEQARALLRRLKD